MSANIKTAIVCGVALAVLLLIASRPVSAQTHAPSATAASYCSATCADRKANRRIRRSYWCNSGGWRCHIGVRALDWNNGNWGWHEHVGVRCHSTLLTDFCQDMLSGGQVRKRDGRWRGFWTHPVS
jgi:hypothetical protein